MKELHRGVTIGLTALVVAGSATLATAGGASAHGNGDPICHTNQRTIVRSSPALDPNNHMYTLAAGVGYRAHSFSPAGWVLGHGNDRAQGYVPRANLNC